MPKSKFSEGIKAPMLIGLAENDVASHSFKTHGVESFLSPLPADPTNSPPFNPDRSTSVQPFAEKKRKKKSSSNFRQHRPSHSFEDIFRDEKQDEWPKESSLERKKLKKKIQ